MRKRNLTVLFLLFIGFFPLSAADKEPGAFSCDIDGGTHLIIPEASCILSVTFPLGTSGLYLSGQTGFTYLFNLWDDVHAGNIYFPAGVELLHKPMGLGLSARYYLSLSDITGEGIFETLLLAYLPLVEKPRFRFSMLFSLGVAMFRQYGDSAVFPVTAKIGFRFTIPFRAIEPQAQEEQIPGFQY